jgi:hypothetical protein
LTWDVPLVFHRCQIWNVYGKDHGRLALGSPKTSSGEDLVVDLDPHTTGVLMAHLAATARRP